MIRAWEAEIDDKGNLHMLEKLPVKGPARALVLVLNGEESNASLMSEQALAKDWLRDEEETAWAYLQKAK